MAGYVVGQIYEYIPGQWGKYSGNGLFQGVEDPNKQAKILEHKKALGEVYYKYYNGDKSVLPEIQRLSNLGVGGTFYGVADTSGNRDQLDGLINAGFIGNANGYKTKINEAQEYAKDAIRYAQQYTAALQAVGGDKSKLSLEGITARDNVIKALKKEIATMGSGCYNDVDEESFESLIKDLASGKFLPNSMDPQRLGKTTNLGAATYSASSIHPATNTNQSATTNINNVATRQYPSVATNQQKYIVQQKAPAIKNQIPSTSASRYNPSVIKSKMAQATQQPVLTQTDATALKTKGWVNKKINIKRW